MTDAPAPDWAAIRRHYEDTQDTVTTICNAAGISRSSFEAQRKRQKWRRKNPRPFPPPRGQPGIGAASTHPAPNQAETPPAAVDTAADFAPAVLATPVLRGRLLDRLVAAISMKLEQLERRMTNDLAAGEDSTATDHEREARAIGALIDNLDKITEIETGIGTSTGKSGAALPATDLADEAERCRRELAERLQRIVEAAEKGA